jgi:hypothetical protein
VLKRLERAHRREYQSIFGAFELVREVYGSREGQKIEYVPFDEQLQLPHVVSQIVSPAISQNILWRIWPAFPH